METLNLIKTPLQIAKYAGRQLLGGAWSELPPLLPTRPTRFPMRAANIQYFSTPEIPENIQLGVE